MSMKNKKWDTVVEKINEFRHINRQTAGGGTAEEPVDIPDDVMIECDGLVKIYKTKHRSTGTSGLGSDRKTRRTDGNHREQRKR